MFGSVRLFVCLFVCLFVRALLFEQMHTHLPLPVQGLCVCVCNQLLFRQVAPLRSITLLILIKSLIEFCELCPILLDLLLDRCSSQWSLVPSQSVLQVAS